MHNVVLLVYGIFLLFYVGFVVMILSVTKKQFPTDPKMALMRRIFMLGTVVAVALSVLFVITNKPDYSKLKFGVELVGTKRTNDGK